MVLSIVSTNKVRGEWTITPAYIDGMWYFLEHTEKLACLAYYSEWVPGNPEPGIYEGDITIPAYIDIEGTPYKVVQIGNNTFKNSCVTTLHIPETVELIDETAFVNTYKLKTVTVDEANPAFTMEDGILYSSDQKQLWLYPALMREEDDDEDNRYDEFVVPEGVEEVYSGFQGSRLKKIILPTTLKKLGAWGLSCETLTEIELPETLEYIGEHCFANTQISSALHIPDNVSYLGEFCIYWSQFTSVNVPENITHLEYRTFYGSNNLERVTLHKGIEKIDGAFTDCTKISHIYSMPYTPPEVDSDNPLGLDKSRLGKVTVHVRPGHGKIYRKTPWKEVGPIVEDLASGVEEIGDENTIPDDELCNAYTLAGTAVASNIRYSEMRANLTKGLYIIRTASGKSAKIAVE